MADLVTPAPPVGAAQLARRLPLTVSSSFWGKLGGMVTGTMFARAIGFLFPVLLTRWESRPAFGLIYFFIGAGFPGG